LLTYLRGLRQATYICVPLLPSSITWYRSKGSDAIMLRQPSGRRCSICCL